MTAKDKSTDAGERSRAIAAYDSARDRASEVGRKAGESLDEAPFIALAGGLAAGALIAALLPKSRAEQRLLGPVGERINRGGRAAADAARSAGLDKLGELNLTRNAGEGLVQNIISGLGEAARTSGEAALGAVRGSREG